MLNVLGFDFDEAGSIFKAKEGISSVPDIHELSKLANKLGVQVEHSAAITSLLAAWSSNQDVRSAAREQAAQAKAHHQTPSSAPAFRRQLKPYQVGAVAHMVSALNAANFSVPGAGKTAVTLAAFAALRAQNEVDFLVVIAPFSAFISWQGELDACFDESPKLVRIGGDQAARQRLYAQHRSADVFIMTYQTAANDARFVSEVLSSRKAMLVLDESHYIKRIEGGKWASELIALAPYAKRRVILSGTPAPNSLEDLWSQFTFLWDGPPLLGTRDDFRQRVADDATTSSDFVRDTAGPFIWRTRKSDLELPAPHFHRIPVEMQEYQRAIYTVLSAKVLADLVKSPTERERLRVWRRARMTRLLQAATNPALLAKYSDEFRVPPLDASGTSIESLIARYPEFETPSKVRFAVELASSLVDKGNKVLIWTSFIHNIKTLEKVLSKYDPASIYGDVPRDDAEGEELSREQIIHQFKTSARFPILIANPAACAESVSLHKVCHHAIYLDRTFNGAHFMQSLDRIHRIGLAPDEVVHYWIPIASETIDEVIDARLEEKQRNMLAALQDDIPQISLEAPQEQFSETADEEVDFARVIEHIKEKMRQPRANDPTAC